VGVKCWSCQTETPKRLFCRSCGKVLPASADTNHFELFGLPIRYEVDVKALEKLYRELSLKVHPDRFASAEPHERRFSLEQTTALNDAYKTLKDPSRRAFYLLKLYGIDLDREDAGTQKDMPAIFLEEIMELREELHDAVQAKDLKKAQYMAAEVERRRFAALGDAASLFKILESQRDDAALKKASHALGRVRYFSRFLEEVDAMEEEALS
jgi:molecular chaperone HscB